jgi:hypothetical protein
MGVTNNLYMQMSNSLWQVLPAVLVAGTLVWCSAHLLVGLSRRIGPQAKPAQDESIFYRRRMVNTVAFPGWYYWWHYDVIVTNRRLIINVPFVGNVLNVDYADHSLSIAYHFPFLGVGMDKVTIRHQFNGRSRSIPIYAFRLAEFAYSLQERGVKIS